MADVLDPVFLDFQAALAGRYSLERELGRGGMGIVYLAREVRLDRLVAIKLLPPVLAAQAPLRERFLREARTAARLSHPNIVPIHAVDEAGGFVFYAMAYVEGETLAHRVEVRGPVPPQVAARILREVAWALAYAHDKGVIHRDVKPENILVEQGSGRALVADFGIAHLAQAGGDTGAGEVLGTPDFMSPEQASGEPVDGRSDLYSLGVVGFYALSGRPPFAGATARAVMAKHLTQAAPPVSSLAAAVPPRLAAAVDRCLAKDPGERFASGEDLAAALGAALDARREIPVPVRAFLRKAGWNFAMVVGAVFVAFPFTRGFSDYFGENSIAGGIIAAVLLGAVMASGIVAAAIAPGRRLLRSGYDAQEVAEAARGELAQRREELALEIGVEPTLADRWAGRLAWFGVVMGALGVLAQLGVFAQVVRPGSSREVVLETVFSVALFLGSASVILRARRRVLADITALLWGGPIGRGYFRLAGLGMMKGSAAPRTGHPTELAIGLAAEVLFANLSAAQRRALGNLPAVVARLRDRAHEARRRLAELDQLFAGGGSGREPELRAAREAAQGRLGTVVAALETIRLDLLRLSVGKGTLDSVTADLARAIQIGDQTERLLAGQREVEREIQRA
jgi:hypothetical protein